MTKTIIQTATFRGVARIMLPILAGLLAAGTLRAQVIWNATVGASTDTNWSDTLNWSGGQPGPTANILFTNFGSISAVSNINNVVDITTNVLSLQFSITNLSGTATPVYHTTLINPGITLAVSNNAATPLFWVGTHLDNGASQIEDYTITGNNGTLTVVSTNVGSLMVLQQGSGAVGSHNAILDLSGLGSFNLTAGRLLLASDDASSVNGSNYTSGTLLLAYTNMIRLNGNSSTKPQLDMGDAVSNPNTTCTNILVLGQTNSIYVDAMTVSAYKGSSPGSIVKFNPALAGNNPALYLRGNAATRVGTLAIGDNLGGPGTGTGSASVGLMDLSLGTVDAQVNNCYIGRSQQTINTGGGTGTLLLGAGVFNVNTLILATVGTNNTQASATGTVNVTGTATLVVNSDLVLGSNPNTNSTYSPVAKGTLNLTNGTVYANAITSPSTNGVIGTINVNNGTLYITNTAGTPSQPLAALNLTSATLHLNASLIVTNIVATNVTGTASITVDSIAYPGYGTTTNALISYTGSDPYNNLTFAWPGVYTATVVDNQANNRIDLVVSAGPASPILGSVLWGGGVDSNWNTTSLNWTNGIYTTVYGDTDFVTFNDLAQNSVGQNCTINLAATVLPGSVTVNNSALNYTISGTGGITGSGGLTKAGSGTLTLSTVNSYSGATAINGSTITATVVGALSPNTTLNFGGATNATVNIQGTAQTVAGMTFGNANSNNVVPITITGTPGSALTVTPGNLTVAPAWSSNYLTLNLSGLSSFTYNNAGGTLAVTTGTAQQTPSGQTIVNLAGGTNVITAGTLGVGTSGTSSGIANSTLTLGTNNTLDVGTITMGAGRADGTIQFASGITSGTVTIVGATGGSSTATLNEGNHDSFQASDKPVDLIDTTAGTLNAQFGAMTIGILGATANSTGRGINATASFKMGAGTLTASSLYLGQLSNAANVTNYTATFTTLFSITNGGTAYITNLVLANNSLVTNYAAAADHLTNTATVLLTNGATLNAASIQMGTNASPSVATAVLNWGDASLGNIPGGNLSINTISIALIGSANNHKVNITAGQSGSINSWITGTGTITDVGAGALTLGGNNSFAGTLVMNGTNTLTLTKTNTYNGSTLINSGTLLLGAVASISNSPTINVASNAVFDVSAVTGGFVLSANQSLAGGGTNNGSVTAAPGAQLLPGGAGAAGTLTFNNNLALNGQFITFDLGANPASSSDLLNVIGTVTLNANATIAVNELAGPLATGTYTLMNYASLVPNGHTFVLVGPRNWTLTAGATALTLTVGVGGSANLTWAGDVLQNNFWDVQTTTNWLNAGSLDYFFTLDNVTFDNTGAISTNINLTTTLYPGSVTVNGAQNYTFGGSGQLAGPMALTNNSTGTLTLTTSNFYSGGTVINGGTVQLAFTNGVASQPDLAAGTGPISIALAGALSITNDGNSTLHIILTNIIGGSGNINLPQNQEVSFNGPGSMSNFMGNIYIPAGTGPTAKGDILGTAVNLSSSAVINVANGGTFWAGTSGENIPATINLVGNGNLEGWGALRVDTGAIYSGPVNLTGNATVGSENGAAGTISGVISDGGHNYSLAKLGADTLILTGANTYGGGTIVSNGTLQVGTGLSLLSNGTIPPGGVNIAGTNAILTFVVATNTTQVYNGAISGSGSLNLGYLSGITAPGFGGTLVVNGNNTFTNGVNINGGQFWITNVAALGTPPLGGSKQINISAGTAGHPALHLNGTNGNIVLPNSLSFLTSFIGTTDAPGAVINEAGNNEIDGAFSLTSGGGGTTFWVNGGTLLLTNTLTPITTLRTLEFGGVGNGTVNGVIQDSGTNLLTAVTVAGPGTWTFAGNNTYATNTTVSGGRLLVNGQPTGNGTTIVQTNGTLGGSGTIASMVNVLAGGTIQGGDANYANELTVTTLNLGLASTNITYSKFTVSAMGAVNVSTLNVNGTNLVQILDPASSLSVGQYPLFYYFNSPVGGTSGSAGIQIGTLPAGVTANVQDNGSGTIELNVTSVGVIVMQPPGITSLTLTNGNVYISGTNGQAGGTYYLLTTTNLANPVSQWNTVATNVLGVANYTFIGTNAAGNLGQQFYRLSSTNYNPVAPY